jgi:hypothetical protein
LAIILVLFVWPPEKKLLSLVATASTEKATVCQEIRWFALLEDRLFRLELMDPRRPRRPCYNEFTFFHFEHLAKTASLRNSFRILHAVSLPF